MRNADKAAWVGLISAALLVGREIGGTRVSIRDVSGAVEIAENLYNETTIACHARPTAAL